MKVLLVLLSLSGGAGQSFIHWTQKCSHFTEVSWSSAASVVKRQVEPGQFDVFGQLLSSFRKLYTDTDRYQQQAFPSRCPDFAVTLLCHKYTPKDKKCPFALSFVFMASESHGKVTTSRWKSRGLTTIAAPRHDAQHPRGGGREVCGSPGRSDGAHTEHRQQHHGDHPQERQGRGENGHSSEQTISVVWGNYCNVFIQQQIYSELF